MKRDDHGVLVLASRWVTPFAALFSGALLANWPAGGGIGFVAGLAFALPVSLNALIFGVPAARAAAPPIVLRLLLAAGVAAAFVSVGLPGMRASAQVSEAGAFLVTGAGLSLALLAVMGRAASLRDASW